MGPKTPKPLNNEKIRIIVYRNKMEKLDKKFDDF